MKRFPHLWQSIFVYSLVLILVSLGMGDFFHRSNYEDKAMNMALGVSSELRRALNGQPLAAANIFLLAFSKNQNKFWLEDDQGKLIAGERLNDVSGKELQSPLQGKKKGEGVQLWEAAPKESRLLVVAPLELKDTSATFYTLFSPPPDNAFDVGMYKEIVTIAVIAGLLALWMAYAVCRPLRQLQREVWEITGSLPLKKVTVSGSDEIADVAFAVNRLVDGLTRYITGMRQLISNISHELRSPLARMALSLEMIGEGLASGCPAEGPLEPSREQQRREHKARLAQKHFLTMQEELVHMDKLIGKTLLFTTVDVRDPDTLTAGLPLSQLCTKASFRYETTFQQAGLRFGYDIEPDIAVRGDETLLMQLLSNLLDNAVKYSGDAGEPVRLNLARQGDEAVLTVENGCEPLPAESVERLFEPFYRHEQNTGTGVGLGLSLVQRIAALHGGRVSAEGIDRGLRISVRLPLLGNGRQPLSA